MNEIISQLISVGGSIVTTLLAAWAKSYFERRKLAAAERKSGSGSTG